MSTVVDPISRRAERTRPAEAQAPAHCRSCGAGDLHEVISFGVLPIAEVLISEEHLDLPDATAPLDLMFCPRCALLQVKQFVAPETVYVASYPYHSSLCRSLCDHFQASAERLIDRLGLTSADRVIEIASNDGYMLKHFAQRSIHVLGIDPARGPAGAAEAAGVPTLCEFFDQRLAGILRKLQYTARLVIANNTLNIIPDLTGCIAGIREILAGDGTAVFEVPYLVNLIEDGTFDSIFHQNTAYFSLTALDRLFRFHGLHVNDAEAVPSQMGGSLRIFVSHQAAPTEGLRAMLDEEQARGVARIDYYEHFAGRVRAEADRLREMLVRIKAQGQRVVAYGAAGGMATTLLNVVGADRSLVEYAVDINPHKQGRYTPGTRLKIFPPGKLLEDRPDYVLLLAWNYADEVLAQQAEYRQGGGRFIIPFTEPHMV